MSNLPPPPGSDEPTGPGETPPNPYGAPQPPPYGQPQAPYGQPPAGPAYPAYGQTGPQEGGKGLAITALILAFIPCLNLVAFVLALVVLIGKKAGKGLAIAALVISVAWAAVALLLVFVRGLAVRRPHRRPEDRGVLHGRRPHR